MSGHSKWSKIKRAKETTDAKKGQVFGKLAKEIASAARQGGSDPNANVLLRETIARAKKANMPQANIDRLLKEKDATDIESVTYEAFGPGGSALLIMAETDNLNRTVSSVRTIMKNHGGSLGGPNSVRWKFSDTFTPQYPVKLDEADQTSLLELIDELNENEDIAQVYTDSA